MGIGGIIGIFLTNKICRVQVYKEQGLILIAMAFLAVLIILWLDTVYVSEKLSLRSETNAEMQHTTS